MDIDTALLELINAIKELSPEIWRIYMAQINVLIIKKSITAGIWFLLTMFCFISTIVMAKDKDAKYEDFDPDLPLYSGLLGIIFLFFMIAVIVGNIGLVLNPEYIVIDMLLDNIR